MGVGLVKCLFCVHCYDHLPFPFIIIIYHNDSQLRGLLPETFGNGWRHSGGFPGVLVVKNLPANAGDVRGVGSIPGSGRPPWRRTWQATPVFLPGESHGQRSLAGYGPQDHTVSDTTEVTEQEHCDVFCLTTIFFLI